MWPPWRLLPCVDEHAGVKRRQPDRGSPRDELPPVSGGCTSFEVKLLGMRRPTTVSGTRDQRIEAIMGLQRGRASRRQLLSAGIGSNTIDRLLRCGRLAWIHRGVYGTSRRVTVPLAEETAALLALRDACVLSQDTAARIWGIRPPGAGDQRVHVLVPGPGPAARLDGVCTHRTTVLAPTDIRTRHGLPVVSVARALLDIAPTETYRALESAVGQALYLRLITESELDALRERCVGRRGCRRLATLLDSWQQPAMTRSRAEELFLSLVRKAELPPPQVNTHWESRERDFHWPDARLIVEIDGWESHGLRPAFERDRRRDAKALAAGSSTMRITWRQLRDEALPVMVSLAQALTAAALSGRSSPDPS
jgi:very-short-patch-repair endonuclease